MGLPRERAITNMQLGPTFASVAGKLSVAAFRGAQKQYTFRGERLGECLGHLRSAMVYPCFYDFCMRGKIPLQIAFFNQYWWLQSSVILSEPRVAVCMADALEKIYEK